MPTPAAMRRLADLDRRLERLERMRTAVISGRPISTGQAIEALDAARDATMAQVRQAKAEAARLRAGRAA